jgi:TPR repeat protein
VSKNYVEAVKWHKLAAANGHSGSQYSLGAMYAEGMGLIQNYVKGHMWTNLAAIGGASSAVKNRELLNARMTPQQIAEAQKLAKECLARNFKKCD